MGLCMNPVLRTEARAVQPRPKARGSVDWPPVELPRFEIPT